MTELMHCILDMMSNGWLASALFRTNDKQYHKKKEKKNRNFLDRM